MSHKEEASLTVAAFLFPDRKRWEAHAPDLDRVSCRLGYRFRDEGISLPPVQDLAGHLSSSSDLSSFRSAVRFRNRIELRRFDQLWLTSEGAELKSTQGDAR